MTVLLADDHPLVRKGFRRILEDDPDIQVIAEAANGFDVVTLAEKLCPRVIVMDICMAGLNGIEATRHILKVLPATAILVVSMYSEDRHIRSALAAGALGYMFKGAIDADLAGAVKRVAEGHNVIAPAPIPRVRDDRTFRLTPRQMQILRLVAEGKPNTEIARLLGLSTNTVNNHRASLMRTLGVHRVADLVLYAVRVGLA